MKFWLCAVVMVFGGAIVAKPYRALSTSEAGAWFFDTSNTLPVQQGLKLSIEPVPVWAVYASQLERIAAIPILTPDLAGSIVYEQNTERFFVYNADGSFTQVTPGTAPPDPYNGTHIALSFDIPPPAGLSRIILRWDIPGAAEPFQDWNGVGSINIDVPNTAVVVPGVYTLIVAGLDVDGNGVLFGSIEGDLTTVPGESSGVFAISSTLVITGVSGVFAGRDGGLSQYIEEAP